MSTAPNEYRASLPEVPSAPSRHQVDPIIAGYLIATLEAHGTISVAAWNKALALSPKQATR